MNLSNIMALVVVTGNPVFYFFKTSLLIRTEKIIRFVIGQWQQDTKNFLPAGFLFINLVIVSLLACALWVAIVK